MTPALKAMVEAMAAEIVRQGNEEKSRGTAVWYPSDPTNPADVRSISLDGDIDLEKVARAGLEAVKLAGDFDEVAQAGAMAEPFQMPDGQTFTPGQIVASTCWRAMLDAILKPDCD